MLRRTGFKRKALPERKPMAPARQVRRVAPRAQAPCWQKAQEPSSSQAAQGCRGAARFFENIS